MSDHNTAELNKIAQTDTIAMLEQISKDIKLTDYTLSRCITSGTDHFIKLKVTTIEEVKEYRNKIQAQNK